MQTPAIAVRAAPTCMLCGREGTTFAERLQDRVFSVPGEWTHRRCAPCGLVWLDPRPQPETIPELYREYFTHGDAEGPPMGRFCAAVLARAYGYPTDVLPPAGTAARLLSLLPPVRDLFGGSVLYLHSRPGATLLDVGCARGDFLKGMRALGWNVAGVEPDPEAAAVAIRRLGTVVSTGVLEEARLPDQAFDAVTLNHVLEHVPDPIATLAECRRVLRPGGRVVVATPNADALGSRVFGRHWLHWDPPRHFFVFTRSALRETARRAGLRVLELRTLTRGARWSWAASRAIAAGKRPADGVGTRSAGALVFYAAEQLVTAAAPVGEELLLVGTL